MNEPGIRTVENGSGKSRTRQEGGEKRMTEEYRGRRIKSAANLRRDGRWTVAVQVDGLRFNADDGVGYILKVEAEKESLNLGRRLVDRGRA